LQKSSIKPPYCSIFITRNIIIVDRQRFSTMKYLEFDENIIKNYYENCSKEDVIDLLNEYKSNVDSIVADLEGCKQKSSKELGDMLHFHSCIFSYVGFQNLHFAFKELEAKCNAGVQLITLIPTLNEIIAAVKNSNDVLDTIINTNQLTVA
jgi:hypothetical protein